MNKTEKRKKKKEKTRKNKYKNKKTKKFDRKKPEYCLEIYIINNKISENEWKRKEIRSK